jgi:hypothetical protein
MKKTAYLLSTLILFQSCYSYKTFELKDYETIKPKKVKIELNDSKKIKGRIIKINEDEITFNSKNSALTIPKSSIVKIEKRKFSLWKTGAGVLLAEAIIIIIYMISYSYSGKI